MRKFLRKLVYMLSFVIRPRKVLVFSSFPNFSDNPYALYLYLIKNKEYDKYKKVWILDKPSADLISAIHKTNEKTIVSYSTLKNWYYVIIARYIFSSHNAYGYLRFHQQDKLFNLWHGMPLKKIGFDNGETPSEFYGNALYTASTSPFFAECLSTAFRIQKKHVLLTGIPRNDLLFEESEFYQNLINKHHYKSVGMWMPTFRQTIDNNLNDATMDEGAANYWNPSVLEELNAFLQKTNNFLILKLHPADILQQTVLGKYSNLLVLYNKDLPARFAYQLLGKMDYLITDYSSVFVDYLTLRRPIGFLLNDADAYQKGRQLYLEPTEDNLPGLILKTMEDVKDFIHNHEKYPVKNTDLFTIYSDANNCKRLVEALDL